MENFKLNTIEEALEDFREGKFVIVVDDEDRENEGDLICAAEKITPEMVNFMLKNARGHHQSQQGTGPATPGAGQYVAAGNAIHRDHRQDRRMHYRCVCTRPRSYHQGSGRPHIDTPDLRTPRTRESALRPGQRCVAP